jgi:hypothetical protein
LKKAAQKLLFVLACGVETSTSIDEVLFLIDCLGAAPWQNQKLTKSVASLND